MLIFLVIEPSRVNFLLRKVNGDLGLGKIHKQSGVIMTSCPILLPYFPVTETSDTGKTINGDFQNRKP